MWRNLTFIHIKIFDLSVLSQKKKIIICFTDFRFWSSFFEFSFNLVVLQTWKMNMITVWMPQDCMACTWHYQYCSCWARWRTGSKLGLLHLMEVYYIITSSRVASALTRTTCPAVNNLYCTYSTILFYFHLSAHLLPPSPTYSVKQRANPGRLAWPQISAKSIFASPARFY